MVVIALTIHSGDVPGKANQLVACAEKDDTKPGKVNSL